MSPTARHIAIAIFLSLISANTTLQAEESSGGPLYRLVSRIRQHRNATIAYAPAAAVPTFTAAPAAGYDCSGGSDPYGVASILNGMRAGAGLHPLAYDPGLSAWASQNNSAQCRWGIGHH
ncbi:MAG: hypothetical protein JO344_19335, partial [Planctomycetaceae bacterium]|nr:hypothetical protein [Planctomycetaceae bacterium]